MFDRISTLSGFLLLGLFVVLCGGSPAIAQDAAWHVGKSSGEVWLSGSGAQTVALTADAVLKPGDSVRTGRNGRVLLARGEETILISPNSIVGIPTAPKDGLSTTIVQQAGSILLEVEKRNVNHFEVETPFFAAVVKGTQFRVSVSTSDSSVDVLRGQVQVSDFKSGQFALVLPGQVAKVLARELGGLSLTGSGSLNAIQQGQPRASSVPFVPVPKGGFSAPLDVVPKEPLVRTASATTAEPPAAAFAGAGGSPTFHRSDEGTFNPAPNTDLSKSSSPSPRRSDEGTFNPAPNSDISRDGRPDGRPRPSPDRSASAASVARSLVSSSGGGASEGGGGSGWSPDPKAWGEGFFGPADRRNNRNEDITLELAFCATIGGFVSLTVGIQRWWRRRKQPAR